MSNDPSAEDPSWIGLRADVAEPDSPPAPVAWGERTRLYLDYRAALQQFIQTALRERTDYGSVEAVSNSGKPYTTKPSLLKPGAEKLLGWLNARAQFQEDSAAWAQAGSVGGVFIWKCLLLSPDGVILGEGKGAADLREKSGWTVNNALKICCKRAMVDAVLRVAGVSDFFTQDIEEPSQRASFDAGAAAGNGEQRAPDAAGPVYGGRPREDRPPNMAGGSARRGASEAQIGFIEKLALRAGRDLADLASAYQVKEIAQITSGQAHTIIDQLKAEVGM